MKSRTSFFSGIVFMSIIRANLRQFGLISILACLVLLFLIPRQVYVDTPDDFVYELYAETSYHLLVYMINTWVSWTIFALSIGIGLLHTRYLQVKKASDWLHSLPIKRHILLLNQIISGSILLLIPIFITAVATFVTYFFMNEPREYLTDLTCWIALTIFSLLIYMFTVLLGTFTGRTIIQGGLLLLTFSIPFDEVYYQNYYLFYGFPMNYTINTSDLVDPTGDALGTNLPWSSNMAYILQSAVLNKHYVLYNLLYVLIIIVMVAVAMWLSKKRPLERVNEVFSIKYPASICKYIFTLGTMLLGGSYFQDIVNVYDSAILNALNNYSPLTTLYIGYGMGAVLGYLFAEMAIRWSWRVFDWHALRGLLVFGIVVFFFLLALRADITGYVHRIPDTSDIENIIIKDLTLNDNRSISKDLMQLSVSRSYIEDVRKLHKKIVTGQLSENAQTSYASVSLFILYKLKNGSELARSYTFPVDFSDPDFKSVTDSPYFKRSVWDLSRINPSEVISLNFDGFIPSFDNQPLFIEDPKTLKEVLPIIVEDLLNLTYDEMILFKNSWGNLQFEIKDRKDWVYNDNFNINWKKSYHKLNAWLQAKGMLRQARKIPSNVDFVDLYIRKDLMTDALRESIKSPTDESFPDITVISGTFIFFQRFSDPAQIEELLNKSYHLDTGNNDYLINIPIKEEQIYFIPLNMDSSDLPSFSK